MTKPLCDTRYWPQARLRMGLTQSVQCHRAAKHCAVALNSGAWNVHRHTCGLHGYGLSSVYNWYYQPIEKCSKLGGSGL